MLNFSKSRTGGGSAPKQTEPAEAAESPASGSAQNQPIEFSEKKMRNAEKWFDKANGLVTGRSYDYAIDSYITGLDLWPEAVETGHMKLRVAAYTRKEKKGKGPGMVEQLKVKLVSDPHEAMLAYEKLWAKDPTNLDNLKGVIDNAAKANYEDTVLYFAPIYFEAAKDHAEVSKKVTKEPFEFLRDVYMKLGERCEARTDMVKALQYFEGAQTALTILAKHVKTKGVDYAKQLSDVATKVTILKGRYKEDGDFRKSVKDLDAQREGQDSERMVIGKARLSELIDEARQNLERSPEDGSAVRKLVELLLKGNTTKHQNEAIQALEAAFKRTDNYQFMIRADDIRIRQMRDAAITAKNEGDNLEFRRARKVQLRFETEVFENRVKHYPTDNKYKYELAKRYVVFQEYDKAIPLFQEAKTDPKQRVACMRDLGRCFRKRGYYDLAINELQQAISYHESSGDNDLSRSLQYELGLSAMEAKRYQDAEQAFGTLIQLDYNYGEKRSEGSARDLLQQVQEKLEASDEPGSTDQQVA